ncbi:MAG: InlB B-repeat-containing protein, partial [Clostridia bacterium]|nr:InlB B-repeat-containing protein [Clostridia bacterium]
MKRFFALILVLAMMFQLFPMAALSEDGIVIDGWKSYKAAPLLRAENGYATVTWIIGDETGRFDVDTSAGVLLSDIIPSSPKQEGYHFIAWLDGEGNPVDPSTVTITEDITVTAEFKEIVYHTVTFKVDSNTVKEVTLEDEATIGSKNMPDDPTKEGYRFDGWFASGSEVTAETTVTADMTVVAKFTELITVTFDWSSDEEILQAVIQVAKGNAIGSQLPEVPENPGWTGKWVEQGSSMTEVTAETVVTEAFTAVPDYEMIKYIVTYLKEDG